MKRTATAVWHGSGKDGGGYLSTQSTVLDKTQYSFNSRFADAKGTNPEELLAAAHAGCFTMKLSFLLSEAGFIPDTLETTCIINFENGTTISQSHLKVNASVPGMPTEYFDSCIKDAEQNCPISKVLKAEITVEYVLEDQI